MLQRNDIIRIMQKANLPADDYWVTAGAGLVMHGVKETTHDIDIGCTDELFKCLLHKGMGCRVSGDKSRVLELDSDIEVIENWFVDHIVQIDGLPVASLEDIKRQKEQLGREKDIADIKRIDEFLG